MKTLIMLSAIPASGKSTWARKYRDEHENVFIVSSDEIRMEICGGDFHNQSKQSLVWETFDQRIHEYANKDENVTVILDALNDVNAVRYKYLSSTPEFDKKILVMFDFDIEKSQEYNEKRDPAVRVPKDIVLMLANKFEQPSKEVLDLVDEVIHINCNW